MTSYGCFRATAQWTVALTLLSVGVSAATRPGMAPDQALRRLTEGNRRYVSGKPSGPNRHSKRRTEVAAGQYPTAVVVGCSDSRVPAEIVFDAGLGDLFATRTAGNVLGPDTVGSIEYAVANLDVKLILVLGHERCGAVQAAVKGGTYPGSIGTIVRKIAPAAEWARKQSGDVLHAAIEENVREVIRGLKASKPLLADPIRAGRVKVVGAVYDLDSGKVIRVAETAPR
jgi:carbonic anhydrase